MTLHLQNIATLYRCLHTSLRFNKFGGRRTLYGDCSDFAQRFTGRLALLCGVCANTTGVLLLVLFFSMRQTIANHSTLGSPSDADFDGDGVSDHLDLDQDNDGILNSAEGYISFASLTDFPADSYLLLAEAVSTVEDESLGQAAGSVFRYPLLNGMGMPSIDFVGTVIQTNTSVDWSVQQLLPKFKHQRAGQSLVRWKFMRAGSDVQATANLDLTISDLDGNRRESITIRKDEIAGYSVASSTNLQVDDTVAGKLVFTATGLTDNTSNDAVILHLRNASELNVTYASAPNVKVLPGLANDAAGFRHNFIAGELDRYVPIPVVQDSDGDGYPDHRDLDSNNDGLADADGDFDLDGDGMIDGSIDQDGVPLFEVERVAETEAQVVEGIDGSVETRAPESNAPESNVLESGAQESEVPASNTSLDEPLSDPQSNLEPATRVNVPADATLNRFSDLDRDSIADSVEGMGDTDGDGVPNLYDLDSDNDGLSDVIEAGVQDLDHDGMVDDAENAPVKTYTTVVPDFDGDGLPDFLDTDSDQDSKFDLVEAGGVDLDDNGMVDDLVDQNGDGWDDRLSLTPLPLPDSDSDGNSDVLDIDAGATNSVVLEDFQQISENTESKNNIVTGVSGGAGCALNTDARAIDPVLWVFLLLLLGHALKRHIASFHTRAIHVSNR